MMNPDTDKPKWFTLDRTGDVPAVMQGWLLTRHSSRSGGPINLYGGATRDDPTRLHIDGAAALRTVGGTFVLYVRNHAFGRFRTSVHTNADALTRTEIIDACGGFYAARGALAALGKPVEEIID